MGRGGEQRGGCCWGGLTDQKVTLRLAPAWTTRLAKHVPPRERLAFPKRQASVNFIYFMPRRANWVAAHMTPMSKTLKTYYHTS